VARGARYTADERGCRFLAARDRARAAPRRLRPARLGYRRSSAIAANCSNAACRSSAISRKVRKLRAGSVLRAIEHFPELDLGDLPKGNRFPWKGLWCTGRSHLVGFREMRRSPLERIATSLSRIASNTRSFSAIGSAASSRRKARLLSRIFQRSTVMTFPTGIVARISSMLQRANGGARYSETVLHPMRLPPSNK